jgi:hypothetical protein
MKLRNNEELLESKDSLEKSRIFGDKYSERYSFTEKLEE